MKYDEIKNNSLAELLKKSADLRDELFHLGLKSKTAQLEDKSKMSQTRRDIARVQTKITEIKNGNQV